MTANFKIIGFNENQGIVSVKYSDLLPPVSVDIPFDENGLYITGDLLNEYIKGFIPFEFLDRSERIKNGVANANQIRDMVQAEIIVEPETNSNSQNAIMWTNINSEAALASILIKWGLLKDDPTTIPVVTVQ